MQTPKILSGPSCLKSLKDSLDGPTALVSDRGLSQLGVPQKVAALLGTSEIYDFLEGEPTAAEVDRLAEALRDRQLTVVGLGGGSALDLTKLAAATSRGSLPADAYGECANPLPGSLPTVLIPTTAGTGSEMSRTAVFTNREGRKTWGWGEELQAEMAVLDPELTVGLPPTATVLTAVDALSHALEAATAINRTSLTRNLAEQAVSMIPEALAEVLATPADLPARERLLNASALAGIALNSCGTGLAHALAHALGSLVKVSHGLAIAWSLRVTLEWNPTAEYGLFPWLRSDPFGNLSRWLDQLPIPALPTFNARELQEALLLPENLPMLANNATPVQPRDLEQLSQRLCSYC